MIDVGWLVHGLEIVDLLVRYVTTVEVPVGWMTTLDVLAGVIEVFLGRLTAVATTVAHHAAEWLFLSAMPRQSQC